MTLLIALALAADVEEPEVPEVEVPTGPDRSAPPVVPPPEVLVLAEPEVHELSDAVTVWHVSVPGVRKVAVSILPRRGRADLDLGRHREAVLGWSVDIANGSHASTELAQLEDLHEIDVWSSMRTHYGMLAVDAPREELPLALKLLGEMVADPTFPETELQRKLADDRLYYERRGPSRPGAVANALLSYAWYPPDSPYGERPDLSQYDGITGEGLRADYDRWLDMGPIDVLVVGDVTFDAVEAPLRAMLKDHGTPGAIARDLVVDTPKGVRVLASAMPNQEQVTVMMRTTAPGLFSEDFVPAWAGRYVLGGHFLSRLNANLREDKGWTYGTRASLDVTEKQGTLTISVDVDGANVAGAVREIESELSRIADEGVTASELSLAQRRLVASWNESLVTADEAHSTYLSNLENREPLADRRARRLALSTVTPEQVQQVASSHWGPDGDRLWVFVGEQEAVQAQLDDLGWTAEWVDPSDAILGKVPPATP